MEEKIKRIFLSILLCLCICIFPGTELQAYGKGSASEEANTSEELMEETLDFLNLQEIDMKMQEIFPKNQETLHNLVKEIATGKIKLNKDLINRILSYGILGNMGEAKKICSLIFLLGILSAVFSSFSNLFENKQIANLASYFIYTALMLALLLTFRETVAITRETLENMVLFMKLLIPAFAASLGIMLKGMTVAAFYQTFFLIIALIESLMLLVLLPAVSGCTFLILINGVGEEERLGSLIEILQKGIRFVLKLMTGAVGGYAFLQSMITPVIDNLKTQTLHKTIAAVPGIGNLANSVTELVLGSALLIKNSVGTAVMILLLSFCSIPMIRIAIFGVAVKLSGGLIGIVADRRMVDSVSRVGDSIFLLLKIVAAAVGLFLITIAIMLV